MQLHNCACLPGPNLKHNTFYSIYTQTLPNFKLYLELDPQLKELILSFNQCKYSCSLAILTKLNIKTDLYLHIHADVLIDLITKQCISLYVEPFISLKLTKVALDFNISIQQLENELINLISTKKLSGKIDSVSKVLIFFVLIVDILL